VLRLRSAINEAKRHDRDRDKHWVALIDGGTDQLEGVLESIGRAGCRVTVILDIIHVLEDLWDWRTRVRRWGRSGAASTVGVRLRLVS